MSALDSITDPYERKARLYPALLALAPVGAAFVISYGSSLSARSALISFLCGCGVLFLLARTAQMLGKRREPVLFVKWGGKPTTQLLRHRNPRVEPPTKKKYHASLSKGAGVKFPTEEQEAADHASADQAYQSGIRWLLEQTRDKKKHALIFAANISYGFWRNSYGLKWIGMAFSLMVVLYAALKLQVLTTDWSASSSRLQAADPGSMTVLVVGLLFFFFWSMAVRKHAVESAAWDYADLLLRAAWREKKTAA